MTALAFSAILCAGCASSAKPLPVSDPEADSLCTTFGYQPGTQQFSECWTEVDQAVQRRNRSAHARLNCAPMGAHVVCQ